MNNPLIVYKASPQTKNRTFLHSSSKKHFKPSQRSNHVHQRNPKLHFRARSRIHLKLLRLRHHIRTHLHQGQKVFHFETASNLGTNEYMQKYRRNQEKRVPMEDEKKAKTCLVCSMPVEYIKMARLMSTGRVCYVFC
jgi:hypothetical protein